MPYRAYLEEAGFLASSFSEYGLFANLKETFRPPASLSLAFLAFEYS